MDTPSPYRRIGLFVVGLLLVFGAAAAIGSAVEPTEIESNERHGDETMSTHASEATHGDHQETQAHEPAGLGIAEGGYALRLSPTQLERGEARELRFTIDGPDGPVTRFDELHERRMHLIVVRRDGTGFQHLHPEMDAQGAWSIPIELAQPGVYRAFADFSVGGEQHTLAGDLFVSGGEFEARPFPPAQPLDSTDGYEVRLSAGEPRAGEPASLTFAVSENGHAVHGLEPYLGAKGHLVALREGDLAFLHVHPEEAAGGHGHGEEAAHGHEAGANEIAFDATFPTAGRYRLYLQFKHEGAVRTVEFTVEVPR
ncbi:MAG: FixH family protein [Actinomycetota bacterium]|nr:FixH family protein [Actinomycetota bacterium]